MNKDNFMAYAIPLKIIAIVVLFAQIIACSESEIFQEGKQYTIFEVGVGGASKVYPETSRPVVFEFFSYGCSHCKHFSPVLNGWAEKQEVQVTFIPVVWDEVTELYAKAFYFIKEKDDFHELHEGLFELLSNASRIDSIEDYKINLIEWLSKQGIQPISALQALDSSKYDMELAHAVLLSKHYKITVTPTLVVNEKYRINNNTLKSQQELIAVATQLIEK